MFCAPGLIFGVPVFVFCALRLIFSGTEGVRSRFHVFGARTYFRRYRGRRLPVSCFVLPDSFSAVTRATSPVFMFCALGLIFGGTEGVGSQFHVLRSDTLFRRYRGCRFPFSCFACPNSFSEEPSASGLVFMFCAAGLVFSGAECVGSHFSCFVLLDSFSAVPRASAPVFIFCTL
jgi:hypothetical protein